MRKITLILAATAVGVTAVAGCGGGGGHTAQARKPSTAAPAPSTTVPPPAPKPAVPAPKPSRAESDTEITQVAALVQNWWGNLPQTTKEHRCNTLAAVGPTATVPVVPEEFRQSAPPNGLNHWVSLTEIQGSAGKQLPALTALH